MESEVGHTLPGAGAKVQGPLAPAPKSATVGRMHYLHTTLEVKMIFHLYGDIHGDTKTWYSIYACEWLPYFQVQPCSINAAAEDKHYTFSEKGHHGNNKYSDYNSPISR